MRRDRHPGRRRPRTVLGGLLTVVARVVVADPALVRPLRRARTWGPQGPSVSGVRTAFTQQFPTESLYRGSMRGYCDTRRRRKTRRRRRSVVGRGHVSLWTNSGDSGTWHPKRVLDIVDL